MAPRTPPFEKRTFDGLDRGVGGDLHVGGAEERGAGVAAGDGHDGGHHQVLNEGARDDNLHGRRFFKIGRIVTEGRTGGRAILAEGLEIVVRVIFRVNNLRRKRGLERVEEANVLVLVLLLVVDDDVQGVLGEGVGLDDGRAHAVELADLGGALEHLHGVGVVGDLVPAGAGEGVSGWRAQRRSQGSRHKRPRTGSR